MKKIILPLCLLASQLVAAPLLYEGFNSNVTERVGWMSSWHRLQGEVSSVESSIKVPGLSASSGMLILTKKGEALAQIDVDYDGTYYGAYRFRLAEVKKDGVVGLLIAKPDLEELTPKLASLSFLAKGWRLENGVILAEGKKSQDVEGLALQAKQTYLVLFKVENESGGKRAVSMWVLNEQQAKYCAGRSFDEGRLNEADLSEEKGGVVQRMSVEPGKKVRLSLSKGDVIACIAKFSPKAIFDEIRLSTLSLGDAAGVAEE